MAHGKSKVTLNGDIIEVKLSGTFNKEGILKYCEQVKSLVISLKDKPFAMLVDDTKVEGGTPEAYEVLQQYNLWLSGQPIIAKAIVIDDVVTESILKQRTPELAKQNTRYFNHIEEARDWLINSLNLIRKPI